MKNKAVIVFIIVFAVCIFFVFSIPSTVSYEKIAEEQPPVVSHVLASVTKYGPTGNPMANGEMPYDGAVAVSDRTIPFGTVVEVDNKTYVVKDRTAKWIHDRHGLTVDIYSEETNDEMLEFGRKTLQVNFIK